MEVPKLCSLCLLSRPGNMVVDSMMRIPVPQPSINEEESAGRLTEMDRDEGILCSDFYVLTVDFPTNIVVNRAFDDWISVFPVPPPILLLHIPFPLHHMSSII